VIVQRQMPAGGHAGWCVGELEAGMLAIGCNRKKGSW
jgi:hypothetical protein